jgi:hypothetical protein
VSVGYENIIIPLPATDANFLIFDNPSVLFIHNILLGQKQIRLALPPVDIPTLHHKKIIS